ncbi:MAG: hypothetical protein IT353_02325 [Gemmatimonadaceae bacterium]|nr:hypothetical protein [Gemmatimonadaceae bacterium]
MLITACSATPDATDVPVERVQASVPATPVVLDSVMVLAAERALRQFLAASRESSADRVALDTLTSCGDAGNAYFPSTILAAFTLLPFEAHGDTVVGRAEVITVAEQDIDRRMANRFVARERVRTDVLEWDIIPADDGRLVVCNGLRFGYAGADSLTTWRPEGTSYTSARRLADSIFSVRP